MTLIMAAAAIYGVLQLALLASPVRSLKLTTVLVTVAVGVYGSGVMAVLIEYFYARAAVSHPGQSLTEAMGNGSYTLVPVVEELAQIAPLVLAGVNLKIRSQLGFADFVVLGAATGAGLGLLEVLLSHMLDAQRAFPLPGGGGWMLSGGIGSIGKGSPYIPDWSTVLSTWLPNSLGTLDFSFTETSLGINLHLVWGAVDGLGVALLLRARGWRRLLGLLPLVYAIGHHALFNYTGGGSAGAGWAKTLFRFPDAVLEWAPLVCLVLAMALDYTAIRRGRQAMPAILLDAEREGLTGLGALGGFAAWRVPWSLLIALRFARMRRSLCYAAGRVPPDRLQSLHAAVAATAARMNASNHQGAWEKTRVRSLLKSARHLRPWRRRWPMMVIPLILMLPSLLFLGVGSFTSTKDLQKWFTTGNGPRILLWFGIAALAWTLLQLVLLLRAWRKARQQPLAEIVALIRLRVWAAAGALATGSLLLFVHYRQGEPLDGDATGPAAMLLAFLEDLDLYLGIAFTILALFGLLMLFPPAGLALAGGGVAVGAAGSLGVAEVSALGVAGIALMANGSQGGSSDAMPSESNGGTSGSSPGRQSWQAGDDIDGIAAGKELRFPHSRHTVSGSGTGTAKTKNSVIMRGHEREVAQDIEGIAAGRAEWVKSLSRYKINGRTYGVEESGTVFPDSGANIVNLNRVEYGALREIARARGDVSASPRLARDPKFVENPEAIEKALKIYNGIMP
ncbi:PrsW family intramembrane metalloprotease [Streptomyces sp. NPDC032198]|uniref:PrsW family intramembrane metalloprotease n=1 Tax=Streptomyces sp. NPDC032198 TaxID=3155127 RepID=UPI0033C60935